MPKPTPPLSTTDESQNTLPLKNGTISETSPPLSAETVACEIALKTQSFKDYGQGDDELTEYINDVIEAYAAQVSAGKDKRIEKLTHQAALLRKAVDRLRIEIGKALDVWTYDKLYSKLCLYQALEETRGLAATDESQNTLSLKNGTISETNPLLSAEDAFNRLDESGYLSDVLTGHRERFTEWAEVYAAQVSADKDKRIEELEGENELKAANYAHMLMAAKEMEKKKDEVWLERDTLQAANDKLTQQVELLREAGIDLLDDVRIQYGYPCQAPDQLKAEALASALAATAPTGVK